jgi:AhpD family alkylhydroperoxidase
MQTTEQFKVPTRDQVSPANQVWFDKLEKMAGHVPNLYAVFAYSEHALGNYMTLQAGRTSLRPKEKEVINLVVSQINGCEYCLAAHTGIARALGFTDEQILAIRRATIAGNPNLDALAKLVKGITGNKGHADPMLLDNFFAAGYSKGALADVVIAIADKIITNYMFALTKIPIDYPLAPAL